jgi:hypothetical protein
MLRNFICSTQRRKAFGIPRQRFLSFRLAISDRQSMITHIDGYPLFIQPSTKHTLMKFPLFMNSQKQIFVDFPKYLNREIFVVALNMSCSFKGQRLAWLWRGEAEKSEIVDLWFYVLRVYLNCVFLKR